MFSDFSRSEKQLQKFQKNNETSQKLLENVYGKDQQQIWTFNLPIHHTDEEASK